MKKNVLKIILGTIMTLVFIYTTIKVLKKTDEMNFDFLTWIGIAGVIISIVVTFRSFKALDYIFITLPTYILCLVFFISSVLNLSLEFTFAIIILPIIYFFRIAMIAWNDD
ncbi:hypothetical protein ACQKP0_14340 [Heyndrickxia sp. NPDC080065]|uniref:hypothetical protein n=1 Tax=Heyndrickxia sp. NPDC080065 TaxID=3390568 RepID=UPI003CFCBCAC